MPGTGAGSSGRMLPARPRLCSHQSSESDPDSPSAGCQPPPGCRYSDHRVTCGIICRSWGDGCAEPGAESGLDKSIACVQGSSGCWMSFTHNLGLYLLFSTSEKGLGASVSWQCRGTKEPTHLKPQLGCGTRRVAVELEKDSEAEAGGSSTAFSPL